MRTVRVGLLGFGRVGGAVARSAAPAAPWIEASGLALSFERALVRNVNDPSRSADRRRTSGGVEVPLVDDQAAFLAGEYDVVVEALGGVEPARSLVTALLQRGTPVVTANKSLVAAAGGELAAAAARGRTALRYEASALAGVPFLGTFGARPLARAVERLAGIVNGTSNYILSAMETDRLSFGEALHRAQALGLAEPDPRADVEGRDAAEKLVLLLHLLGAEGVRREAIETAAIDALDAADLRTARAFGGRVKPVVYARLQPQVATGDGAQLAADWQAPAAVECFVGPAFVESTDALADIGGALNGIRLDGRFVRGLFFAGPGAGPDVTAATILDDVVEAARQPPEPSGEASREFSRSDWSRLVRAPDSRWFIRLAFPSQAPDWPAISDLLAGNGVWIGRTSEPRAEPGGDTLWALTHGASRGCIETALASLSAASGARPYAIRVLEGPAAEGSAR